MVLQYTTDKRVQRASSIGERRQVFAEVWSKLNLLFSLLYIAGSEAG